MIRPDLLKAVFESLGSHPYLAPEDFSVNEYNNREGQPCLAIEYRYDTTLFFKFHIPSQKTKESKEVYRDAYRFQTTVRPGRESVEEAFLAEERSGLLAEIKEWLRRLHNDIISEPALRQFKEHAEAINKLKERLSVLPDEPMSRSDVQAFSEGLDKLKVEMTDQLKQQTADKEELKGRVDELSREIEFLKRTLDSMTKRQWGALLATRVQRWKSRFTLRQLSAGTKVLKLLLPGEAEGSLDSISDAIDGIADAVDDTKKQVPKG